MNTPLTAAIEAVQAALTEGMTPQEAATHAVRAAAPILTESGYATGYTDGYQLGYIAGNKAATNNP